MPLRCKHSLARFEPDVRILRDRGIGARTESGAQAGREMIGVRLGLQQYEEAKQQQAQIGETQRPALASGAHLHVP